MGGTSSTHGRGEECMQEFSEKKHERKRLIVDERIILKWRLRVI
jgi:hypothetical protein